LTHSPNGKSGLIRDLARWCGAAVISFPVGMITGREAGERAAAGEHGHGDQRDGIVVVAGPGGWTVLALENFRISAALAELLGHDI
jgi:hypothetical protein